MTICGVRCNIRGSQHGGCSARQRYGAGGDDAAYISRGTATSRIAGGSPDSLHLRNSKSVSDIQVPGWPVARAST